VKRKPGTADNGSGREQHSGESPKCGPDNGILSGLPQTLKERAVANHLKADKRLQILHLLVEGNSVRSTARLTGSQIRTILSHLVSAGEHCRELMDHSMRNLSLSHLEIDEQWTFCLKKQGQLTQTEKANVLIGDQYLFLALDQATKLVPCYALGKRNDETTDRFIRDLRERIIVPNNVNVPWDEKPQLSTDGFSSYPSAINTEFGSHVNYGTIVKAFKETEQPGRYGPPDVVSTDRRRIRGVNDLSTICTSHVERLNGSTRQWCKRFTRLTYAFSKKRANLFAAISLHIAYYNFCRRHSSLRITPAMAAGVTDTLWSLEHLLQAGSTWTG
jgi:IS1 family transposase